MHTTMKGKRSSIGPASKQRLFIHDLLFIDHFTVSGDMRHC